MFGEVGVACTVGLVGVALLGLKCVYNEKHGDLSRREDVEKECHELNDWQFMKLPIEIFEIED